MLLGCPRLFHFEPRPEVIEKREANQCRRDEDEVAQENLVPPEVGEGPHGHEWREQEDHRGGHLNDEKELALLYDLKH